MLRSSAVNVRRLRHAPASRATWSEPHKSCVDHRIVWRAFVRFERVESLHRRGTTALAVLAVVCHHRMFQQRRATLLVRAVPSPVVGMLCVVHRGRTTPHVRSAVACHQGIVTALRTCTVESHRANA